jgi:branched-chain amino acid transport system substrate-binding protein
VRANTSEVLIGFTYCQARAPRSPSTRKKAFETAAEIINKNYDFDLPLAKGEALPGLGGAKVELTFASPIRSTEG